MAADPYKYFRVEAHEVVGDLAKCLSQLESNCDAGLITKLLRLAHTLKGAARIVRHKELADLSHELESVLEPLRANPVPQRLEPALALLDRMTAQVQALSAPAPIAAAPVTSAEPEPIAPPPARLESAAIDEALGGLSIIHAVVARMRSIQDPVALSRNLDQLDRELAEVRRDVEHLRLSAAGSLYAALERTARDAANLVGKRVRFAFEGADVRVDAQVIASLHGALVQLVRNAVVHGIEAPAERMTARKPPEGRVTITARALGRSIALTCADDGRGLDVGAIKAAAHKRGINLGPDPDATELFRALLRGGISTAREVTVLAGRGIGLDLVRDAVESVSGELSVKTGTLGTAITLIVPVSVTATSVINVALGDRVVALPQSAVRRVSRISAADLVPGGDGASLCFDDTTVPAAPLGALFGGATEHGKTAVFVEAGGAMAAFTVDRTLGIDDVIVRSIPLGTPIDPIVWGMALDARGTPYPVVEPTALVAAVNRAARVRPAAPVKRLPILVVDDSLTTRMLEQSILESAGYEVDLAVSGEDALSKLAHNSYAMMLTDVEMPGMDGFALVAELRARPAFAKLPAVLVTSRDAAEDRQRGRDVGAQGYVVKGRFDQGELLSLIKKLVTG